MFTLRCLLGAGPVRAPRQARACGRVWACLVGLGLGARARAGAAPRRVFFTARPKRCVLQPFAKRAVRLPALPALPRRPSRCLCVCLARSSAGACGGACCWSVSVLLLLREGGGRRVEGVLLLLAARCCSLLFAAAAHTPPPTACLGGCCSSCSLWLSPPKPHKQAHSLSWTLTPVHPLSPSSH